MGVAFGNVLLLLFLAPVYVAMVGIGSGTCCSDERLVCRGSWSVRRYVLALRLFKN